jgi:hypothetical protein
MGRTLAATTRLTGRRGTTMTIDALPDRARRTRNRKATRPAMAIGEADANIVACPACARPLDAGGRRCPDCGTHIIAGVRATTASTFIAGGLLVGLIVGTSVTGALTIVTRPVAIDPLAPAAAIPSTAPAASAITAASPAPVTPADPTIPSAAVSALRQVAALQQRFADDAGRLAAALAVAEPSSVDLARILRSMNANAAFGEQLSTEVGSWTTAAALSTQLDQLYADVRALAGEGLDSSLTNTPAYVRTSEAMLGVLASLPEVDAAARPLADRAGVDLAPLIFPTDATP